MAAELLIELTLWHLHETHLDLALVYVSLPCADE